MLSGIHHVQIMIPTGAENRARSFYCDFLGLKEIPKPEPLSVRGGLWLELNEFQIHIGIQENFDGGNSKVHLAYLVEDLDNWRKRLKAINVEVIEGIPIPDFNRFEFRDPFNNRIEFLQRS